MGIPRGETARGNAGVCSEPCGGVSGATSLPHSPLSCPASCGASSTPRLLGSSTGVSGILDRPIPATPRLRRGFSLQARRSFSEGGKSGDDGWSGGRVATRMSSRTSERSERRSGIHNHECLCGASLELQSRSQHTAVEMGPGSRFAWPGRRVFVWLASNSPLSCPASCGASSTPRLLGSSTGVSGILDRPIPATPRLRRGFSLQARRSFSEGGKSGDDGWMCGAIPPPSPAAPENPRGRAGLRCARHRSLRQGQNSRE
jgi:hypothetical protein